MRTLHGITGIQVYMCRDLEDLNAFLLEHDGNIIDIQCTDEFFHVIYKAIEG